MKFLYVIVPVSCALILSACTETSDVIDSGFADVSASGDFDRDLDRDQPIIVGGLEDSGDGFAHHTGIDADDGELISEAGLLPTTSVSSLPTSGSAVYFGIYEVSGVHNADLDDGVLTGQGFLEAGAITLNANFNNGTLRGTSDDGDLVVRGNFDSKDIDGSVEYIGVDGDLDGLIGGDRTVGIFHGEGEGEIFAGGFIADPN